MPDWIVAAAFLAGLSGGSLVTWYGIQQAAARQRADQRIAELTAHVAKLATELGQTDKDMENYRRIKDSRLYRESFEDIAFALVQVGHRARIAEEELRTIARLSEIATTPKK